MANFFAELKRRQMFRVAAAYAVVAWLILQVVNNLTPGLNLPNWAVALVIVLLGAGFPVALLFCWIQQLAPTDGATQAKVGRLDWILVGGLAAVIALILYQQLAPSGASVAQDKTGTENTAQAPASTGISIAVLPFANLSGDTSQEFFSDGTSEEITTALARIPGLRVVGRSSAFQFKGQNRDLRVIGQALNARYLIDGSVRQAGNRVRITAQLIQTDDGIGLWTENYDRELTDIFVIQEDIAQAIAGALRVPLGLQQGALLVSNRSINPDSYQQYLRAKAMLRARSPTVSLPQAAAMLEEVVARHADYAPAWALLALTYDLIPQNNPAWFTGSANELRGIVATSQPKAEAAAQRAVRLDPTLADGYVPLGSVQQRAGRLLLAEDTFSKALALDRSNADVLLAYSNFLAGVGRVKEALPLKEQARALEPFAPIFTITTAAVLWLNGQNDAAEAMAKELPSTTVPATMLAHFYVSQGRYSEAADLLREAPTSPYPADAYQTAIRIIRDGPVSAPAQPLPLMGFLGFVHLRSATPERLLEEHERNAEAAYFQALNSAVLWHPVYAAVRKTERFKNYVRKAGLVEYWRAKGWPDMCRPVGADDFVCD